MATVQELLMSRFKPLPPSSHQACGVCDHGRTVAIQATQRRLQAAEQRQTPHL